MGVYDANENLAVASLSGLSHLAHLLGIATTMSHFHSLGAQMESRGYLTVASLPQSDTNMNSSMTPNFHTLAVAPTKKPLIYNSGKRPWRRTQATLFPDAAPKAYRQARDAPSETTMNGKGRRLCEMAILSANYVPTAVVPVKNPGATCPPVVKKWVIIYYYQFLINANYHFPSAMII